jgi:hypothetical protein
MGYRCFYVYICRLSHITACCTVTAATSSGIADGSSALLLCNEAGLNGATPLARILAFSSYAHEPEWFTTAPVGAIRALLKQLNWTVDQVRVRVVVLFLSFVVFVIYRWFKRSTYIVLLYEVGVFVA